MHAPQGLGDVQLANPERVALVVGLRAHYFVEDRVVLLRDDAAVLELVLRVGLAASTWLALFQGLAALLCLRLRDLSRVIIVLIVLTRVHLIC